MQIAICDDHEIIAKEIETLIHKFNKIKGLGGDIVYFSKPSNLYEYMEHNDVDLVFMDLEFMDEKEDGILWCKKIHKKWPNILITILTAYEKRYKEGYAVRAFRFMTKPIIEEELFDNLEAVMEELSLTDSVSIMRRGISHNILIKDICYLSAQSGGSELWSKTDMYYCEESLLQWANKLPAELFFRCHHKYLVNFACITKVEPHKLTLINGERIPVSRRKWKEFQIAYMRWDAKYN